MNYSKCLAIFTVITVFTIASLFFTSCEQTLINGINNTGDYPSLDERFRSYEIIEIDNQALLNIVETQSNGEINMEMRRAVSHPELAKLSAKMSREELIADDFTAEFIDESGQSTPIVVPEIHFVKGKLDNQEGHIYMSVSEENFSAIIENEENSFMIEPVSEYVPNAKPNEYIKYKISDIIIHEEGHTCSSTEELTEDLGIVDDTSLNNEAPLEDRAPKCRKAELTLTAERSVSRAFPNRAATVLWMKKRAWAADKFFHEKNGVKLDFVIKNAYVYSGFNIVAQSNAENALDRWQDFGQASWALGAMKRRDANILFTSRDIEGGVAYLKSGCVAKYLSYAVVQRYQTNLLTNHVLAHEIAHIFGATHTSGNGGLMAASVDAVLLTLAAEENKTMRTKTKDEIKAHLNTFNGCLGRWNCN